MRRRDFIKAVSGSAAAWPIAALAQQLEKKARIGVLMGIEQSDPDAQPRASAFQKQLEALGWTNGHHIEIDFRWLARDADSLRKDAAELLGSNPDLLVADTTVVLSTLRPLSGNIPVVFLRVSDPVGAGFVNSLARPGGNLTGITNFEYAIGGKWLQLLKQLAPDISRVTVLVYPGMVAHDGLWETISTAARGLAVEVIPTPVRGGVEIESAMVAAAAKTNSGIILLPHAIIETNRIRIIDLALQHRLPVIYPLRHYAAAGGLIAYGLEPLNLYVQAAVYVDRILRGAKPADLPIQQPTKFELSINIKTAKVLGLEVPPNLLALANEVIE